MVAAFLDVHREGFTRLAFHDHDVFHRGRILQRFVGGLLQRHELAATESAVGRDQQRALRVIDAIAQGFGAEAAKHH